MNVLHLISSAGHYGAENVLLNLAGSLERLGCRVALGVFVNARRPNTEIAEQARQQGLQVALIPCGGRADRSTVEAIRREIKSSGIELVHTHGYKADLYGYAAVRGAATPILATCHNWTGETLSLRLYAMLDRWVLRRFRMAVAVSESVAAQLRRAEVAPDRIAIISNGIDVARFREARPTLGEGIGKGDRLVVGMVGRLVREKGAEYLLRAAREVLPLHPDTLFVLVGEGPARAEFEQMAHELRIEGRVIFAGQRQDMPGVYASMDVLVLPSLNEGMPLVILEALAARRAVVATRVGAIPQCIVPRETGLLVEPANAAGLRDAIAELLGDAALRRDLGERGSAWVEQHHSSDAMARQYLALYDRLLGRPTSPPEPLPVAHSAALR